MKPGETIPMNQDDLRYVSGAPPRDRSFARELDAELERLRVFLR